MPWYKCSVVGQDFPGSILGKSQLIGFYTTRFIAATTADEAEMLALNNLKDELRLRLPEGTPKQTAARVTFEDIVEIETPESPVVQTGFCFFEMGS